MAISVRIRSVKYNKPALFSFLITVFAVVNSLAQAPNAFNYQALAKDALGKSIVNKAVQIRSSIVNGSATGTIEYTETHTPTTDDQGFFTLELGNGTPVTGTFKDVTWGTGTKWLKIEMDATGGNNFSLVGASQLLSVPYALYANSAGNGSNDPGDLYDGKIVDLEKSTRLDNKLISGKSIGKGALSLITTLIDSDKSIYISGAITGPFTIGTFTIDHVKYNQFIAKILLDGTVVWAKGMKLKNALGGLPVLAGNTIIITSGLDISGMYDQTTFSLSGIGNSDDLILAVNTSDGSLVWNQKFDNTRRTSSPGVFSDGQVLYVASHFNRAGFKIGNTTFSNSQSSFYIAQLNKLNGVPNWALASGANSTGESNVLSITKDAGKLYLIGGFTNQVILGNLSLKDSSNTYNPAFVCEFSNAGQFINATPIKASATQINGQNVFFHQGELFLSVGQLPAYAFYKLNLATKKYSQLLIESPTYIYKDTTNNYLYTNKLGKFSFEGTKISTKSIQNSFYATSSVTPKGGGICYLSSSGTKFSLGNTQYNLDQSDYLLMKYDLNNETVMEQKIIKHLNCYITGPIIAGDRQFLISTGGQIKVNGTILSDLVLMEF